MNILLVSNGYPPTAFGGVEIYTHTLANYLSQNGYQVTVFCREAAPNRADYELFCDVVDGVKVIRLVNDYKKIRSIEDTYVDHKIESIFGDIFDELSPNIVHFNHLIALSAGLPLIPKKRKIPYVVTLHDFWPICQRVNLIDGHQQECPGPLMGAICSNCVHMDYQEIKKVRQIIKAMIPIPIRRMFRAFTLYGDGLPPVLDASQEVFNHRHKMFKDAILSASVLITPSNFVKLKFTMNGYPGNSIQVIPLGLRLSQGDFAKEPTQGPIQMAFVGSLLPIKGIDVLIKAFRNVEEENIQLKIFGRDDIIPSYSRYLRDLGSSDHRITFEGPFPIEARDEIYRDMDVLIIPSVVSESFSIVAREAIIHGVPVIASDIGALPEIIVHGQNGFLVPARNVESLSWYISEISKNPGFLSSLNLPGPIPILSISDHGREIGNIYQQALTQSNEG